MSTTLCAAIASFPVDIRDDAKSIANDLARLIPSKTGSAVPLPSSVVYDTAVLGYCGAISNSTLEYMFHLCLELLPHPRFFMRQLQILLL